MTYNPAEPTVLDRIRRLVRDHSNDPVEEFFPDETYERVIGQHTNWKRACAEMAVSVMAMIQEDPTRVEDLGWSQRTDALKLLHQRMLTEADAEDAAETAGDVPIAAPWMVFVDGPAW